MNTSPEHVRLFVACEVPEDVKEAIGSLINDIQPLVDPPRR